MVAQISKKVAKNIKGGTLLAILLPILAIVMIGRVILKFTGLEKLVRGANLVNNAKADVPSGGDPGISDCSCSSTGTEGGSCSGTGY